MKRLAVTLAIVSAIAVLALAAPAPLPAQLMGPLAEEPATTINDTELKSFAAAAVGVKRVADSYLPVLAGMRTPEDKARVETAAYSEIKQIVENEGFSVSRFNQILALAGASPGLADRIRSHMHREH